VDTASFLAVTVGLRGLDAARTKLLTLPGISEVDVTAELIAALRGLNGVAWDLAVRSDALDRGHPDRGSWELAVRQVAVPRIQAALAAALGPVLLTEAAPLARYGCMDLLAQFADPTTGRSGACLLLVPSETGSRLPVLDDEPVPVMTAGQVLRLPSAWYFDAA
jgi:hypothetical protein